MSIATLRLLAAPLAAVAVLAAACGGAQSPAAPVADQPTPVVTDAPAPADDPAAPAPSGWLTEAERDAAAADKPDTIWVAAAFLPAGAEDPVALPELETRYIASTPAADQLDAVPAAEALALLRDASPAGVQNPLAGVDLTLFGFETAETDAGTVITLDFAEGLAATRSMSSLQGRMALNQLAGIVAHHFPEADAFQVTVEGQPEPEAFGGLDTTQPNPIRQ